ncbi:MAG: hypothetical protein L6367_07430, partial [Cellulomonas sp.]|nr:hypothetical protein [Cellulomonas sp.]
PLIGHPHLRQVALNGSTVVADGDLSPLLRMPALRNLLIANRRGYRPSRADLAAHGLNDSDWDPPLDRCK